MTQSAAVSQSIAVAEPQRGLLELTWTAIRANLLPGAILWLAGGLILLAWYFVPPIHEVMERVGHLKEQYGFAYSMIGMALFAGVVPFFMQRLVKDTGQRRDMGMLVFVIVFWALKGIEIDALYRLQAKLFGSGHSPLTVVKKVAFDQFVYCTIWGVPTMTLGMEWAQRGLLRGPWPRGRRFGQWCARTLLPVMVSNWCVSIPGVAVIYLMPPSLQIPIQNLVVCTFVLLLMFMTRHEEPVIMDRSAM